MPKHYVARGMMLTIVAITASCADATRVATPAGNEVTASSLQIGPSPERQALTDIARGIALSLGSAQARSEMKGAMRAAPFLEHKLELRSYLNRSRLTALAERSGFTYDQLAEKLQLVRPLEIYMPAAVHRSKWTGGDDVLVVSQLEDSSRMIAFNLKGEEVFVSRDQAPSVPAIAIVPVETRFDKPLNMSEWKNQDDQNGQSIGTLAPFNPKTKNLIACGDECGGGSGSYGYKPAGFYMLFSRLVDMGEPWTKGNPEIEVHVHGPTSPYNNQYGADLACSGQHALPERTFDQNNSFWNGEVLIWLQSEADNFNAQFPDGHHILFWEDDDTACRLKYDKPVLRDALSATLAVVGGAALKAGGFGGLSIPFVLASFLASDLFSADWLTSNDDYLGALVPASAHNDSWSDANYTLMKGSSVNGRAMIIVR